MLLVPKGAPLEATLRDVIAATTLVAAEDWLPGATALGSIYDEDALDDPLDPSIDRARLLDMLLQVGVPSSAGPHLVDALLDRESVVDLGGPRASFRPPTLFEHAALGDVLSELVSMLPPSRVRIDRAFLARGLNHCELGGDGIARIRLLPTNGTTLAGRTHALVHEMGHALIGVQRYDGRAYAAEYGSRDYGPLLRAESFDRPCDEEALVRAIADAWLLRRNVSWARTYPGAIDDAGRDLDGDDLAGWCRFRLAQGLGGPYEQPLQGVRSLSLAAR
jgi:hypothetical protein